MTTRVPPAERERDRRPADPDELPEELLEHVVGGLAPEAALARYRYFRELAGVPVDPAESRRR